MVFDEAKAAEILYGSGKPPTGATMATAGEAPAKATAAKPEQRQERDAASVLFPDMRREREPDPPMYDALAHLRDGDANKPTEDAEKPQQPFELKAPDGKVLDQTFATSYATTAQELGITQDQAQRFFDKVAPVLEARQQQAVAALSQQWADATRNDGEVGGRQLDASLTTAKSVLAKYGTSKLTELLNGGLGNHPELVRLLTRIGAALEDR